MITAVKNTGFDELIREADSMADPVKFRVGYSSEGYRQDREKGGTQVRPNAVIISSNRKQGRDPWFLDESEKARGLEIARDLIDCWLARNASGVMTKAAELAKHMLDVAKAHVAAGRSVDGPMKPLSERYKEIKKHVYHAGDKPILVRSGELVEHMSEAVTVRRARR